MADLIQRSQVSKGAESLAKALDQHADGAFGDHVDLSNVDTDDGRKIVQHALANDPQRLQGLGGFGGDMLGKLLPILAPIVMGYVAKQALAGGQKDADGNLLGGLVSNLLGGGGQGSSGNMLGSLLGSLLGGGQASAPAAQQNQSGGGDVLGSLLGQILGR